MVFRELAVHVSDLVVTKNVFSLILMGVCHLQAAKQWYQSGSRECMVTTYLLLYKLFILFLVLYMFHYPNSDALIQVKILG